MAEYGAAPCCCCNNVRAIMKLGADGVYCRDCLAHNSKISERLEKEIEGLRAELAEAQKDTERLDSLQALIEGTVDNDLCWRIFHTKIDCTIQLSPFHEKHFDNGYRNIRDGIDKIILGAKTKES